MKRKTKRRKMPLYHQLAALNSNMNPVNNEDIEKFNYLLQDISQKTIETPKRIGEISLCCVKKLREEHGKIVTLLEFLEHASTGLKDYASKLKYDQVASLLVFLISSSTDGRVTCEIEVQLVSKLSGIAINTIQELDIVEYLELRAKYFDKGGNSVSKYK